MAVNFSTNFTPGVEPDDYVPTTISGMGDAIGKIAEQVIRQFSAKNPLALFEKMPVNNGTTIEQMFVEMVESQAYDRSGANALTRKDPSIVVRYFDDWTPAKFHTSVDTSEIRKVLIGEKSASDIATKIVSVLSQSDTNEKYQTLKSLLANARQEADGGTGNVKNSLIKYSTVAYDEVNSTVDFKKLLTELRDVVDGMTFVNDDFNTAEIKKYTNREDIVIVMPYKLRNKIDVQDLAGVFNLEKTEIKDRIIVVDTEAEEGYDYVYVLDKMAILDYTRLYEMLNQLNADGRFWNYFLHVERMYGISPLFDACYLKVGVESQEQGE